LIALCGSWILPTPVQKHQIAESVPAWPSASGSLQNTLPPQGGFAVGACSHCCCADPIAAAAAFADGDGGGVVVMEEEEEECLVF